MFQACQMQWSLCEKNTKIINRTGVAYILKDVEVKMSQTT